MKKLVKLVLMLCFTLPGALSSYAYYGAETGNEKCEGIPIEIKQAGSCTGPSRSNYIIPTINGHTLFVSFTENLGQVAVEITTAAGGYVQTSSCLTPNGLQFYIPLAGDYIVTFTLPNGDEYYGEFTVTD